MVSKVCSYVSPAETVPESNGGAPSGTRCGLSLSAWYAVTEWAAP